MPKNPGSIQCRCLNCDALFFRFPSDIAKGRDKYCSTECRDEDKAGTTKEKTVRVEVICPTCKNTFLVFPSVIKRGAGKYCSDYCAKHRFNDEARFWAFIVKGEHENDQWDWSGHKDKDGYAVFTVNRRNVRASHFSYELHYGPVPEGFIVLHDCPNGEDSPACCNPRHLKIGTQRDNMIDRLRKGRHPHTALTEQDVTEIRKLGQSLKTREIAAQFGVNIWTIQSILARRTWKHLP